MYAIAEDDEGIAMTTENTPTRDEWSVLRRNVKLSALFHHEKKKRIPPVMLKIPDFRSGGKYRTCVQTCASYIQENATGTPEMCLGLKVYVAKRFSNMVGVKAVVHAVVRKREDKKDNPTKYTYIDPSIEYGESYVLFIPIPDIYSDEQRRIILEDPKNARMGGVIFDLDDESEYTKSVLMNQNEKLLMTEENIYHIPLYIVRGENVYAVDYNGATTPI